MLGKLLAASSLASSLNENKPLSSVQAQPDQRPGAIAAIGDGQVSVSLSDLAQSLMGEDGAATGGFENIANLLGGNTDQAFGAFLGQALDKFSGGLSSLASAVFSLPIEDALVAARGATEELRAQLDGRGDLKAQFVSVVQSQTTASGAGVAGAEASLQFRSVSIAFDDDTNAFSLSIDDVSVTQRQAVALADGATLAEAGLSTDSAVAAARSETTIAIKSFEYVRLEGDVLKEGQGFAPVLAAPSYSAGAPSALLADIQDDSLLPVPASLLRQLLSLPEPSEDPQAAAQQAAAGPAASVSATDDLGLLIPGKLWKAINENILSVSRVSFDVSVQQSVAVSLTAGSASHGAATAAQPDPAGVDLQA